MLDVEIIANIEERDIQVIISGDIIIKNFLKEMRFCVEIPPTVAEEIEVPAGNIIEDIGFIGYDLFGSILVDNTSYDPKKAGITINTPTPGQIDFSSIGGLHAGQTLLITLIKS